jgi:sorbitol-specific phosphotransferase system component IIBC
MADNERIGGNVGEKLEISNEAMREMQERNRERLEKAPDRNEKSAETREKEARYEANRNALETQDSGRAERKTRAKTPTYTKTKKATKAVKEAEYKHTIRTIQRDMKPASRAFSKVIHNQTVEKASNVVGSTVARPDSILAGSLTALILTAIVYAIASHYGYVLSGFETIGAFVIGWLIGVIIDWVRKTLRGNAG